MKDLEFQREGLSRDLKWCLDKLDLIETATDEVVIEGLNLALCLKLFVMGTKVERFVTDTTRYYNEKHDTEESQNGTDKEEQEEDSTEDEADAGATVRQD